MDDRAFLWKPVSENDRKLVFLTPGAYNQRIDKVMVKLPDGTLVNSRYSGLHEGENKSIWRFNQTGASFPAGSKVVMQLKDGSGIEYDIGDTSQRNIGTSGKQIENVSEEVSGNITDSIPQGMDTGLGSSVVGAGGYFAPQADFSSFTIPDIPDINVPKANQLGITEEVGDFNLQRYQDVFKIGKEQAQELLDLEIDAMRRYSQSASELIQEQAATEDVFNMGQVAEANRFNQQQRLQAVDVALPEARSIIDEGLERNRQLAQGIIPDTAMDRAFELSARSIGADVASTGGFGAGSVFGQKTSDLLSAEQRLGLMGQGESGISKFIQMGAELNFDSPIKYNPVLSETARSIPTTPPISAAQTAVTQAGAMAGLTTVSPENVITREIQQEQFQAQLDREADKINLESDITQMLTQLNADMFNAQQLASAMNLGIDAAISQQRFEEGREDSQKAAIWNQISGLATSFGVPLIKDWLFGGSSAAAAGTGTAAAAGTGTAAATGAGTAGASAAGATGAGAGAAGASAAGLGATSTGAVVGGGLAAAGIIGTYLIARETETGKSTGQQKRDALRDYSYDLGLFEQEGARETKETMYGTAYGDAPNYNIKLADGSTYDIGLDGGHKIDNYNPAGEQGKTRYAFEIDWSDPRAGQTSATLAPVATMLYGEYAPDFIGHLWNAATSNNSTIAETNANIKNFALNAGMNYQTGLTALATELQNGTITQGQYTELATQWSYLWNNY